MSEEQKPVETQPVPAPENIEQKDIQQEETKTTEETAEQVNWRKFRQVREIERKQKEESDRRANEKEAEATALKAAMEALLNKNQPEAQRNEFDQDETEDERIQKKVNAAIEKKEKEYEQQRRQQEQKEFPQRLAANFSDFHEVCSSENLDYLEYHYPEVAAAFKGNVDGYEKWAAVYKAVKRFVPNTNSNKDKKKAETNSLKPQSMSVPGVTQTGDHVPQVLDDKRRADNWSRMQKVMKGAK